MGFFETFTKRMKRGEKKPDVFEYDVLPNSFRAQVSMIARDSLGEFDSGYGRDVDTWNWIHSTLCKEHAVFELGRGNNCVIQVLEYILNADAEKAFDAIDVVFWAIHRRLEQTDLNKYRTAVEELNHRFFEHNLGYQHTNGQLVRVDSQYAHKEIVIPAIKLMYEERFKGAEEEFMTSHKHYRAGNYKEAMNEALKAFESAMKTICKLRKIAVDEKATAKGLIEALLKGGLIPAEQETHFNNFRVAMESGLPTHRNRNSGHGQGANVKEVPSYFASHALHLAASNIVFLIEAHKANK